MPSDLDSPYDLAALQEACSEMDSREHIFFIESPSADDLFLGRNEGDSLAKALSLADVDVTYYLVTDDATFQKALDDIVIKMNHWEILDGEMPFIHISAHGSDDGIELTDGDCIYWEALTRKLRQVHELVGPCDLPEPAPENIPRINLSLSSCSAFTNYRKTIEAPLPVQFMLGPRKDIGWCQALIGFQIFFYKAFVQGYPFHEAVGIMNFASSEKGGEEPFDYLMAYNFHELAESFAKTFFPIEDSDQGSK